MTKFHAFDNIHNRESDTDVAARENFYLNEMVATSNLHSISLSFSVMCSLNDHFI